MNIIYFVILCPLISCIILLFFDNSLSKKLVKQISIGSIFLSMMISFYSIFYFFKQGLKDVFVFPLWTWMSMDNLKIDFSFLLDGLSITMLVMITTIGFLIHLFSSWYMNFQIGYTRFFAYMNLFIASMILLILANNLIIMYIGWEGVGLCSYLLVGFYHNKINVSYAAMKGFIMTRIGDIFLILSIFFVYKTFGTVDFLKLKYIFQTTKTFEMIQLIDYISIFMLIGVLAKSAQIPLYTWLIDAMVGPTPASALIHSSTMVTSGIYLVARMNFLFSHSEILYYLGIIGSVTLLVACVLALVQKNIKRILAYSTISQIGYMFIALSMQEWSLAINHLVTHAIFKTLLFLSAGAVIILLNHEQNIFKMGDLQKKYPILCYSFLCGGASLASFPILTSGFYSKGNILFSALENNYMLFLISGLFGSLLTSIYTFRMIFLVFFGNSNTSNLNNLVSLKSYSCYFPFGLLIFFSTFIFALINLPLLSVFPKKEYLLVHSSKFLFEICCGCLSVLGVFISYCCWILNKKLVDILLSIKLGKYVYDFLLNFSFFDGLYRYLFIVPYLFISKSLKSDPMKNFLLMFVNKYLSLGKKLKYFHDGYLHSYILFIIFGFFLILFITINLNN